MSRINSIKVERSIRKAATYLRNQREPGKAISMTRKLGGRGESIKLTVSKTGYIRLDIYTPGDQLVYARFNGVNELVFGGATSVSVPAWSRHMPDDQVILILRRELKKLMPCYEDADPLPLTRKVDRRYRLVANCQEWAYYKAMPDTPGDVLRENKNDLVNLLTTSNFVVGGKR